jgi:hypothetical protein
VNSVPAALVLNVMGEALALPIKDAKPEKVMAWSRRLIFILYSLLFCESLRVALR